MLSCYTSLCSRKRCAHGNIRFRESSYKRFLLCMIYAHYYIYLCVRISPDAYHLGFVAIICMADASTRTLGQPRPGWGFPTNGSSELPLSLPYIYIYIYIYIYPCIACVGRPAPVGHQSCRCFDLTKLDKAKFCSVEAENTLKMESEDKISENRSDSPSNSSDPCLYI
jgi:hypothetical protein